MDLAQSHFLSLLLYRNLERTIILYYCYIYITQVATYPRLEAHFILFSHHAIATLYYRKTPQTKFLGVIQVSYLVLVSTYFLCCLFTCYPEDPVRNQ